MKLSREFLKASLSGDIAHIKNYLAIESTELCPADMVLAFGNASYEPVAQRAANLYHEGLAPLIVASGGVTTHTGQSEAWAMSKILQREGVPDSAIIIENNATNTLENVVFSRDLMAAHNVKTIIACGHAVAGRRFLMTLAAHWPEVLPVASHVWNEDGLARDWKKDPATIGRIKDQFSRIQPYIEAGYITEVNIAAINAEAMRRRKHAGLDSPARRVL